MFMPVTCTIEKVIEFHFYLSLLYLIEKMFVHVIKKKTKHILREGIKVERQAPGLVLERGQHTICRARQGSLTI